VEVNGFEPMTLCLQSRCSSQLSYTPDRRFGKPTAFRLKTRTGLIDSGPYQGCFRSANRTELSRKEVFQPHLPVRLPCYDLAPVIGFTLNSASQQLSSGPPNFHGLTGGVYKVRERIHRAIADARLLAIPTSCRRVAACNPN
jgi:hypothetical protein